jgi:simple sugar transport system permease protein
MLKNNLISIEKKSRIQTSTAILILIGSFILALIIVGIALALVGYDPIDVYVKTYTPIFFTLRGTTDTMILLTPLILCSLGVVIAARAGVWNIGIEGQFYIGAIAATGIALFLPDLPAPIMIPLMFIAGALAGGILAGLCILPRIYYGVSEITITILMNYVVIYLLRYLVNIRWNDPSTIALQTPQFTQAARMPILFEGTRVHWGLVIAILIALLTYYVLKRTVWGFEINAIGDNPTAAEYAGMNIGQYFLKLMLVSGSLAGIAGMLEVAGSAYRLQDGISIDYGFSAFVIAYVALLSPLAVIPVSYVFSGLMTARITMQILGLPSPITDMVKGAVLLIVLCVQMYSNYKIKLNFIDLIKKRRKNKFDAEEIIN